MIIAGIDEAGLGPKLGPLVVSSAAFEVDDSSNPDTLSLWDIFSETTTRKKSRTDPRMLITDSKIAYTSRGLPALQNVVLNFSYALKNEKPATSIYELISRLGTNDQIVQLAQSPWFKEALTDTSPPEGQKFAPTTTFNLQNENAGIKYLHCRILSARMLNNLFAEGLNKSEVLLLQTGRHIHHIVKTYSNEQIRITVDKQGGKTYYAPYLTDILGGEWIETIREGRDSSLYRIRKNIYIEFLPKADQNKFTVALASITAKFFREILMNEFNRYFTSRIPSLKPTAGYPEDAKRFFAEITDTLHRDNIESHDIWRQR